MNLLNLGCGGHRPQGEEWWNLDELRKHLKPGTPERTNLDAEPRYIECSLTVDSIPMDFNSVDGILCQHVLEHFCCHDAVHVIKECHSLLKPGGWLCVSVPDAQYFLDNNWRDTRANAEKVFGEPISPDEPWHQSFFDYALFHREHMQVLTPTSLHCLLLAGGFGRSDVAQFRGVREDRTVEMYVWPTRGFDGPPPRNLLELTLKNWPPLEALVAQLNRQRFSAILFARKI